MELNTHLLSLPCSYLFTKVAARARAYQAAHPTEKLIYLSIGDVKAPLPTAVVAATVSAAMEMGNRSTFRGYGPSEGYSFLRETVSAYYAMRGVAISPDEVNISEGAKNDMTIFLRLFSPDNTVLVPDPVYPVYADSNQIDGRRVAFLRGSSENDFLPLPGEDTAGDLIYICSPNNPTGAVYTKDDLRVFVDFARKRGAIILFDAAYEAFIDDDTLPHTIFEIEGARECAIEFCSLSKTAGFTGMRCGYTVVPRELRLAGVPLAPLWQRLYATVQNGVSYPMQRAAEAALKGEGLAESRAQIAVYRENAACLCECLNACHIPHVGGKHAPYVWFQCPDGMRSWPFFDFLAEKAGVIGVPGVGFGDGGEGWFRLSAFGTQEETKEAAERILYAMK